MHRPSSLAPAIWILLGAVSCVGAPTLPEVPTDRETEPCAERGGDTDGDGVCDDADRCEGDDASGDLDLDGRCDDVDPCDQLHEDFHPDWCEVVFVDPAATGAGDGRRWSDAFTSVDAAVEAALARGTEERPFEVWLAEGRYTAPAPGRTVLTMAPGLIVRGGYSATSVHVAEHDGGPSVLSGDFNGDDVPLDLDEVEAERENPRQDSREDNAAVVVVMAEESVLERVEVRDGYADEIRLGVGIEVPARSSGVRIRNCVVADNIGAIRNAGGGGIGVGPEAWVEVIGCTLRDNIAWNGGGIDVVEAEFALLESNVYVDNSAMSQGAGLRAIDTEVDVSHSQFRGNRMVGNSGVALLAARTRGNVTDTVIEDNIGPHALQISPDYAFEVLHVTLADNVDVDGGPALLAGAQTQVSHSVFWGNEADLSTDPRLQPGAIAHTCATTDLRAFDGSNVHLDGTRPETGEPFSAGASRRVLSHRDAGDAFTSACVDAGDTEAADARFPAWRERTTRRDGVLDGASGDPVDLGAHYAVD